MKESIIKIFIGAVIGYFAKVNNFIDYVKVKVNHIFEHESAYVILIVISIILFLRFLNINKKNDGKNYSNNQNNYAKKVYRCK